MNKLWTKDSIEYSKRPWEIEVKQWKASLLKIIVGLIMFSKLCFPKLLPNIMCSSTLPFYFFKINIPRAFTVCLFLNLE